MKKVLINYSHGDSWQWDVSKTLSAKNQFGKIVDFHPPVITASAATEDIQNICYCNAGKIYDILCRSGEKNSAVLVENVPLDMVFHIVTRLKELGVKTVCSCQRKIVTDDELANGCHKNHIRWQFVRFREY